MRKKIKANKSGLVREYLQKHPNASAKDVVEALEDFSITDQTVYNVKAKLREEGKRENIKREIAKVSPFLDKSNGKQEAAFDPRDEKMLGSIEDGKSLDGYQLDLITATRDLAKMAGSYEDLEKLIAVLK